MHVAVIPMKSLLLHFARILLVFEGHSVGECINIIFPWIVTIFNFKVCALKGFCSVTFFPMTYVIGNSRAAL